MLYKLALLVLAIAATGAGLLTVRQQRLEAVHDMAEALDRAAVLEREVWRMRIEAARLTSPEHAQQLLVQIGETRPVVTPWHEPLNVAPPNTRFATSPSHQRDDSL
ncbi:MAG: hypothetical protein KDA20_05790 [Phycisphaerales bacterium]|nr:hypothetical protein [Phycisphaerales bacterium]